MKDLSSRSKLSYLPLTDADRALMLKTIGVPDTDALFEQIPKEARLGRPPDLPAGMAEQDVVSICEGIAARNRHLADLTCFLGAGAYDHYVPAVVESIVSRSEFATTYTPYQPEASQGVLQSIYEYQSLICALTEMEVSNASLYDAATAIGEAAVMAYSVTGRSRVLVSKAVHPHYRQVLRTYVSGLDMQVEEIDYSEGVTSAGLLPARLSEDAACVIVQYPNFFGCVEPLAPLTEAAHSVGALMIVCVDPIALGLLTPPGAFGADIVVGEGQALGVNIGFGGPYLGLFACRMEHVWHIPGRIVGATVDAEGRRSYTLTLQTREQHIRREKATSNICTNQALVALAATVYLSALGKNGLSHVAELCFQKAHYARDAIAERDGFSLPWPAPFFKEFVVKSEKPVSEINRKLLDNGIIGGLDLGQYYPELKNHVLICVTEKRTKEEIDRMVELL
ncbi:MAG: aminomethyl-transferring glycine dehydrogenase subunit GcvPA [Armatimonadetes bacterium]|nr:aminomethyl-transferring glycine dehydrogenase subunit GcvPA [Armatimonadota bacterium]